MKECLCSYCEKGFEPNVYFYLIKDGDKKMFLHKQCIPFMSGGVELEKIEEIPGVEYMNDVKVGEAFGGYAGNFYFLSPETKKLHNEHGPAIILDKGRKQWWLDGKEYIWENWHAEIKKGDQNEKNRTVRHQNNEQRLGMGFKPQI